MDRIGRLLHCEVVDLGRLECSILRLDLELQKVESWMLALVACSAGTSPPPVSPLAGLLVAWKPWGKGEKCFSADGIWQKVWFVLYAKKMSVQF